MVVTDAMVILNTDLPGNANLQLGESTFVVGQNVQVSPQVPIREYLQPDIDRIAELRNGSVVGKNTFVSDSAKAKLPLIFNEYDKRPIGDICAELFNNKFADGVNVRMAKRLYLAANEFCTVPTLLLTISEILDNPIQYLEAFGYKIDDFNNNPNMSLVLRTSVFDPLLQKLIKQSLNCKDFRLFWVNKQLIIKPLNEERVVEIDEVRKVLKNSVTMVHTEFPDVQKRWLMLHSYRTRGKIHVDIGDGVNDTRVLTTLGSIEESVETPNDILHYVRQTGKPPLSASRKKSKYIGELLMADQMMAVQLGNLDLDAWVELYLDKNGKYSSRLQILDFNQASIDYVPKRI